MHIAFVIDHLGGYGAEHSVYRSIHGLSERGHKVDVILLQPIIHRRLPQNVRVFLQGGEPDRLTEERSAHVLDRAIWLRPRPRTLEWAHRAFEWARAANVLHWNRRVLPTKRLLGQASALASYLNVEEPDCVLPQLPRALWATLLGCRITGGHPPVIAAIRGNVHHLSRRSKLKFRRLFSEVAHFVGVSQGHYCPGY